MTPTSFEHRFRFHDLLDVVEIDINGLEFTTDAMVDAFYDRLDDKLLHDHRRWYFLVNYGNCRIAADTWGRFAQRGKQSNIAYSLGTVRVGPCPEVSEVIRKRAQSDMFRANLYADRDSALFALAEMRKRYGTNCRSVVNESFLRVENIRLRFGGLIALDNISFSAHQSEVLSIIGPNGAGKTSMLNVLSGFYRPDHGQIIFEGHDRTHLKTYEVARSGFARTFQNIALFRSMSTLDNIMTGRLSKMRHNVLTDALYIGPARKEELAQREFVEHIIEFLEIQDIRRIPVGKLAYGLQKRVELARALAMEPKILLLDEPMAGMNVEEKEDMVRFILDVNDQFGTTVLLIEHDMGVVMDISSHVIVLDHGIKISEGTADEVRNDAVVIRAYLGES